jgi:hypothetical protein
MVAQYGSEIQLHSNGNPTLLMKYCSEFYDGFSISPFTNDLKNSVYKTYKQWKHKKGFIKK